MALKGTINPQPEVFPINMGEEAAFERSFRLFHAPLRYFCKQLTGADEECEDLVCEIFLTLWRKQTLFESVEHRQAFLYRSAHNACLDFIRNGKRTTQKHEQVGAATTELSDDYLDTMIKTEVWAEIYRAIASLPPQCCKVITLSYLEGMTNQEIADQMGIALKSVKNHKLRGLGILKDKLPDGLMILLFSVTIFK
jgi:RNA polymerase sigma-70 factor (family 1)